MTTQRTPSRQNSNVRRQPIAEIESAQMQTIVPYDEYLLERARTQWQFGDWESLIQLDRETLQHHPDRAKLALLAAAGLLQTGNDAEAREFILLAQDWGVARMLIAQILVAGVYNSLGRAAIAARQQSRSFQHFEKAISIGMPGSHAKLLTQARISEQLSQMNISAQAEHTKTETDATVGLNIAGTQVLHRLDGQDLGAVKQEVQKLKRDIDEELRKEVYKATKTLRSYISVQNYLNTGELTGNMNDWAICPDLALWLIQIIESNDFDLIIEFGSGTSTAIIAKTVEKIRQKTALKTVGGPTQVAFEHLEKYFNITSTDLKQANLDSAVQLILAPLEPWAATGATYSYYACQATLNKIGQGKQFSHVLVLVDGPPGITGKHARYPALPIVLNAINAKKYSFLLDDYERDDEREVGKMWLDDLRKLGVTPTQVAKKMEKDAFLMEFDR